jgi:hypothetical protein
VHFFLRDHKSPFTADEIDDKPQIEKQRESIENARRIASGSVIVTKPGRGFRYEFRTPFVDAESRQLRRYRELSRSTLPVLGPSYVSLALRSPEHKSTGCPSELMPELSAPID